MTLIPGNTLIPATGGDMAAYVARPVTGTPRAAVLMQVELWGMTQHMKEVADKLAEQGYAAVVCDLFRGESPPVPTDPVERWSEIFAGFDDVRCTQDCRKALNWALGESSGLNVNNVFAWGFCMGGRFAHNLGAFDSRLAGVINFYGRVNFERMHNKPFLPIDITRMIEMPYLGVFAQTDSLIPAEDVEKLRQDLLSNPHNQITVYPDTEHAFFNDHRETYHASAAQKAWHSVLSFLDKHS